MSVGSLQMISVTCPNCRTQYSVAVQNVIDVGRDPRFKTLLLQGKLNIGVCPQCGMGGMLGIPLVYHDPEKALLFCLIPQELHINEPERQRTIGEMSNAIIDSLPAERRKGYLLRPRVFLTFQTMLEAILEADGITKEMLQAQQEKAQLISEMVAAVDDSTHLAGLIAEHENKIDYGFFTLLTANIRIAEQSMQADTAQKLAKLREILSERTAIGQEVTEQQEALERAVRGIDENLTREDLLERIVAIEGEHTNRILNVLIALARPLVDYRFFQLLTERIGKAEREKETDFADRLKAIREKILDLTQKLDAEIREHMQEKAKLLAEIIQSTDARATVQARIDQIDSVFVSVLETNIEQGEQQHRHETAEALRSIKNMIVEVFRQSAPLEIRFIDQLLHADYPEETRKILSENRSMINAKLIGLMEVLAKDLADRREKQTGEQLDRIRAQAELLLQ